MEKNKGKRLFVKILDSQYKQLVRMQFDVFKKEKRRISMASIVRDALKQYFERIVKKEG